MRMRVYWFVYFVLLVLLLSVKVVFRLAFNAWNAALLLLCILSLAFLIAGSFGLYRSKSVPGGGRYICFMGNIELPKESDALTVFFSEAAVTLAPPLARLTCIVCIGSEVTIRIPEGCSVRTVCRSTLSSVTSPAGLLHLFEERVLVIGDGPQTQLEVKCLFSKVTLLD